MGKISARRKNRRKNQAERKQRNEKQPAHLVSVNKGAGMGEEMTHGRANNGDGDIRHEPAAHHRQRLLQHLSIACFALPRARISKKKAAGAYKAR